MKISDVNKILPRKNAVIVKIENINKDLLESEYSTEDIIRLRIGEVISKGPDVILPEYCESLQVGDKAIFSEFAGHHLPTSENMYKVIGGYDIVGITTDKDDMNEITVKPTADRLLIETVSENQDEDGLLLTNDSKDPRQADLCYGTVLSIGPSFKDLDIKVGNIIAYPPYAGTIIREYESEESKELKIIVEGDVLLAI